MGSLNLAPDLSLPDSFVTQTCAILARRSAGKTFTALKLAEEMVANGLPFVMIDPTGVCWGLRSSSDGNDSGLPIVILGGEHGDLPLEPTSGRVVAEFVVSSGTSLILDLSLFESRASQDRFVYDFAERLYRLKAKHRQPLHLLVDEADQFIPQRPMPDQMKMLGAWESIVRLGRSRGLGVTMITQRPAVLNKNVLTQIELLIVMQITSPQDRAAIKAWIDGNADASESKVVLDSLASFTPGEAWVWSPAWLRVLQRIRVGTRSTFDSSRTPDAKGVVVQPKRVADVDLGALRSEMAATIEKADANDPVKLKRRVSELERQLAKANADRPEAEVVERVVEVRVPFIPPAVEELIRASSGLADLLTGEAKRLVDLATDAGSQLSDVPAWTPTPAASVPRRVAAVVPQERRERDAQAAANIASMAATGGNCGPAPTLKAGARRMLDTIVRNHPVHYSRPQIGALTGIKHTGGTFGTYFGTLKRAGLIVEQDGLVWPTDAGFDAADATPDSPTSTAEVLEVWRAALKAGARRMLDAVIDAPGHSITRADLAEATGIEATGGTFGTYLGTLKRNGLVDVDGDLVSASEALML